MSKRNEERTREVTSWGQGGSIGWVCGSPDVDVPWKMAMLWAAFMAARIKSEKLADKFHLFTWHNTLLGIWWFLGLIDFFNSTRHVSMQRRGSQPISMGIFCQLIHSYPVNYPSIFQTEAMGDKYLSCTNCIWYFKFNSLRCRLRCHLDQFTVNYTELISIHGAHCQCAGTLSLIPIRFSHQRVGVLRRMSSGIQNKWEIWIRH